MELGVVRDRRENGIGRTADCVMVRWDQDFCFLWTLDSLGFEKLSMDFCCSLDFIVSDFGDCPSLCVLLYAELLPCVPLNTKK